MDVAIIGSGAAGTLAAIHLLRLSRGGQTRVRLTLFEKQAHQYLRGIAYSTLSSHHVLNVPSHHMSALPEEPDHYHDWLEKNAPLVTEPFSPRMVFGQYLEATLTAEVNAKAPSVEFVPELDAVMDVRATSDGRWALETASGSLPLFDKVIFATGNLRPREPKELTIHAAKHPRYYPNPWNLHHHQWPRESSVLFIGTGLSMLDGVLELWSREHRGRIVAFSRKGLLPRPHGSGTTFRMDIPALRALGRVRERLAFVRNCVVKHVEAGGIWQDVMASLRAHTTELWQTLSDQERERFLRHLKSYWESHRHRSPVPQLDLVETLRGRGQMSVRQGRLRRIDHDGVSFLVGWNGDAGTERFDIVVNSTGPINDLRRNVYPPYTSLHAQRLIKADRLGLGLEVDANLNLVGQLGADRNLFALGSLTKGLFWEVTAIPDIRVQAARIALNVLQPEFHPTAEIQI